MSYLIRNEKKKELRILSLVYLLSQGFLIVTSGRWWDDWCFVDQPYWVLRNFAMQMGRPSVIAIIQFVKLLPEFGYRIITFLMFYWCMLFLWRILKEWLELSDMACFWICSVYAVIPANDARIVLSCFPYTIAVFFFMAGMSYLAVVLNKKSITWKNRIICYGLFIVAFTMNSNLVFYGLVLLMILMKERNIKGLLKYVDFLMLPIVFFVAKNSFFPAYGIYAGYNKVTLAGVLVAIMSILLADFKMVKELFSNFMSIGSKKLFCIWIVLVLIFIVLNCKKIWKLIVDLFYNKNEFEMDEKKTVTFTSTVKENVLILVVGVIALSVGLFAYVVVRGTYIISTVGLGGRDAALVAFGAAMIIYALYSLVLKEKLKIYLLTGTIMCGIIFFNIWYISYQSDYYRQLGFQFQLGEHDELKDAYNIVYLGSDPIGTVRFYSLNGNSELVYGVDDKLIMRGFSDTNILNRDMTDLVESGNYHMDSYDTSYKRIDAVVYYSFEIDYLETLKLKMLEIFNHACFEDKLYRNSDMVVYFDGTEEYEQILKQNEYENLE